MGIISVNGFGFDSLSSKLGGKVADKFAGKALGNLPGGKNLDPAAIKAKLTESLKLKEVSAVPEEACKMYNDWIRKSQLEIQKVNKKVQGNFVTKKIIPEVHFEGNNCVQKSASIKSVSDKLNLCKVYNKGKNHTETQLQKTAILVFENGECKSAIEVLKKKVTTTVKQYLPNNTVIAKTAMETPGKACKWYNSTMSEVAWMYENFQSHIYNRARETSVWKLIKRVRPKQELPGMGITIDQQSHRCQQTESEQFKKFEMSVLRVCDKYNKNLDMVQKKLTDNVQVVFEDGQCRVKNWFDYLMEFLGMLEENSAGTTVQPSIYLSVVAVLAFFVF